jgi:ABC-type antimicrobial peptide transport system permease subunit
MRFARFLSTWAADHPVQAVWLAVLACALFLACLPLILTALPIRKVPLRYNLRNLQMRWLTTTATALVFTLVIGLLTVMLAFVTGMYRITEGSGHPGNVIVLSDGATDEAFSNLPYISTEELPDKLQSMIQRSGGEFLVSREVYVIVVYKIPNAPPGGRQRRFVQMRGMYHMRISAAVHEVDLAAGEWPSDAGARTVTIEKDGASAQVAATEIVLGDGVARAFGADRGKEILVPGDVVEIGTNRYWVVVGVMQAGTNTFGSEIWARHTIVQETFGRNNPPSYTSYVVRTANAAVAEAASTELRNFRSSRNLQASPERVYYSKLQETNKQFSWAIYVIAVVMAGGGIAGIVNTMFAAISQRTKDIGVLRLMGYRRWQIFMSFQCESLLIAILGGGLGVFLGSFANGITQTSIVSSGAGGGGKSIVLKLTVDLAVIITGLIFSVFMGALGGLVPSWIAMRLRPLDSLK